MIRFKIKKPPIPKGIAIGKIQKAKTADDGEQLIVSFVHSERYGSVTKAFTPSHIATKSHTWTDGGGG